MLLDTRLSGSSSSFEALRAPRQASRRGDPASIPAGRVLGPRDSPRVPPRSSRRRPVASRSLLDPCRGVKGLFIHSYTHAKNSLLMHVHTLEAPLGAINTKKLMVYRS